VTTGTVAPDPEAVRLRIVTYNVHKCRGMDARSSPQRIAGVLREIEADVIALQEVLCVEGSLAHHDQARFLADTLGLHVRLGVNRTHRGGVYGNAVLTRLPPCGERNYDLSVDGREKRGCMRVDLRLDDTRTLHVFNLHLGTAMWERRQQGQKLIEGGIIDNPELHGPRVVLGDFNDWKRELTPRLLAARLNSVDIRTHLRRTRTYPGLVPVAHVDHIYFDDGLQLENLILHRTRRTLVASDHLPLSADFRLRTPVEHGAEKRGTPVSQTGAPAPGRFSSPI
jgi:endonuclease/exonuclease/phosphatase family metal-dependent hydrolase